MPVRFLVSGLVQGVGFRVFARRAGRQLGLRGYAKNLWDGRVECVVDGSRDAIESYEVALRRGPGMAVVREVVREENSGEVDLPNDFQIW